MIYLTLILSNSDTVYTARLRTVPTNISSVARIPKPSYVKMCALVWARI